MEIIAYIIPICLFVIGQFKRENKFLKWIILIYIWILMGLNTFTPDYNEYAWIYRNSTAWIVDVNVEWGFRLLCAWFYDLGLSYEQFRMVWAAIYVLILNETISKMTKMPNAILPIFIFWPFIVYVSGIRFAMADIIVMYAITHLVRNRKNGGRIYAFLLALAASIHSSVIFYAVFLLSRREKIRNKYIKIFMAILGISVILRFSLLDSIVNLVFSETLIGYKIIKWLSYEANTGVVHMNLVGFSSNIVFVLAYAVIIYQMSISIINYEREAYKETKNMNEYERIKIFRNISALTLLIIPGFIITAEFIRMITGVLLVYYTVYARYTYGCVKTTNANRNIYSILFILITMVYMVFYLESGQGFDFIPTYKNNLFFE